MPKVAILGGGIAGMSAAHELIERGFEVEVYSQPSTEQENVSSYNDHSIFPAYYRHLFDTMRRIPIGNSLSVADNLAVADQGGMFGLNKRIFPKSIRFPGTKRKLKALLHSVFDGKTELTQLEVSVFADKVWPLLTSCKERRLTEFERLGWWEYLETDQQCGAADPCPYKTFLVQELPLFSPSALPNTMSASTGGDLLLQRIFQLLRPGKKKTSLSRYP